MTSLKIILAAALLSSNVFSLANATEGENAPVSVAGKVENIKHSMRTFGFKFKITFADIKYNGSISNIEITRREDRTCDVRVEIENARLFIERTHISGSRHKAACGPIQVDLGTKDNLIVEYQINLDDEGSLQLVDSRFSLTADNFEVKDPEWVKTKGFGMTKSKVQSGLKSGLVENSDLVEAQLVAELPNIYQQLSQHVEDEVVGINAYPRFASLIAN